MEGKLITLGGAWTFTPDGLTNPAGDLAGDPLTDSALEKIKVPGVVRDMDYMEFGYWLHAEEGDEGTEYSVQAFASNAADAADVTRVEGTATYEGDATGLYMKKTFTTDGDTITTIPEESGQFTAESCFKQALVVVM